MWKTDRKSLLKGDWNIKLQRSHVFCEWRVAVFHKGCHDEKMTYYTEDKKDAITVYAKNIVDIQMGRNGFN